MRVRGACRSGPPIRRARYVLPDVIREFRAPLPRRCASTCIRATSEQIAEMVASDRIDCAIATGSEALFSDLTLLPCYRWYRTVIVPKGHPLANGARLSFQGAGRVPADHLYVQLHRAPRLCMRPLPGRR